MEGGDSDAKRPRLDPTFRAGLPQASQAPLQAPTHTPPARVARYPEPSPSRPYPPHTLPPHPSAQPHHPPLPPPQQPPPPLPAPSYREPTGTPLDQRDSRTLPIPEASVRSPGYNSQDRPSYGPSVTYASRPFSEPRTSEPTGLPDQQRRSLTTPAGAEGNLPSMDHGGHPQMYAAMDHPVNGAMHNGYAAIHQHDQYTSPHLGPSQAYAPTPVAGYAQPNIYQTGPQNYTVTRRKQVRAQQACNNCRQRKQKCDEAKPCAFCKEQSLECEYREVPPPKQDRQLTQLSEKLEALSGQINGVMQYLVGMDKIMRHTLEGAISPPNGSRNPSPKVADENDEDVKRLAHRNSNSAGIGAQVSLPELPHRGQAGSDRTDVRDEKQVHLDLESERAVSHLSGRDIESPDEEGEIMLPVDHTTGAHHLRDWPVVLEWFTRAAITNEAYVMEEETNRGCLRIYGRGEGSRSKDDRERSQGLGSPANSDESGSAAPSPPQDGLWGCGFQAGFVAEPQRSNQPHAGGLNPDGSLKLDEKTVRRLHESYLKNVHILQPFLDKQRLARMVDSFIRSYSPPLVIRSPFAVPNVPASVVNSDAHVGTGSKRKRSIPANPIPPPVSSPTSPPAPPLRRAQWPEHSIANALVLLVLALGKICEHKEPLPGPTGSADQSNLTGTSPRPFQSGSPTIAVRPSPPSTNSTISSVASPGDDAPRLFPRSRRSSFDGLSVSERGPRNIDVIPGLAYYAYASYILSNHRAAIDLFSAQACVLAGLYMGQLARPLESWRWIFDACANCRLLIERDKEAFVLSSHSRKRKNAVGPSDVQQALIKSLFWTCLQLESDIRAELDKLHDSGISKYENDMGLPEYVYADMTRLPSDAATTEYMLYYSAQIQLRKILNRAHLALYSKKKVKRAGKLSWGDATASGLWDQLQAWREVLPEQMQWDDSEPPAKDINAARMRGKYYGAAYIITRPFLYHALTKMDPQPSLLDSAQNTPPDTAQGAETKRELDIIGACRQCVHAAMKSTEAFDGLLPDRWIVTNIFGTAHAQFGNMLVLGATHQSWLGSLVPRDELDRLLDRTIHVLRSLVPISPTMKLNTMVLERMQQHLLGIVPESNRSSFSRNPTYDVSPSD